MEIKQEICGQSYKRSLEFKKYKLVYKSFDGSI